MLGPAPKCLQRGQPACPELYEEWHYHQQAQYVWLDEIDGTMVLQTKERRLVGYQERLHIYLQQCLLGLHHDGGHLTDTRHGRIRWSIEEVPDGAGRPL